MNTRLTVVAVIAFAMTVAPCRAEKPLKDYSFIRGVNYGMNGDQPAGAPWREQRRIHSAIREESS